MHQIHLTIGDELWAAIERESTLKGQPVSAEIRQALFEYYSNRISRTGLTAGPPQNGG